MSTLATETPLMPRRILEFTRPSTMTPQQARGWVARQLAEWQTPAEVVDRAMVITSELVTNACTHGPSDGPVTVSVRGLSGGQVEIQVHDQGRIPPAEWKTPEQNEMGHGFGLTIVRAMSASFDVQLHRFYGKTCSAVLASAGLAA